MSLFSKAFTETVHVRIRSSGQGQGYRGKKCVCISHSRVAWLQLKGNCSCIVLLVNEYYIQPS